MLTQHWDLFFISQDALGWGWVLIRASSCWVDSCFIDRTFGISVKKAYLVLKRQIKSYKWYFANSTLISAYPGIILTSVKFHLIWGALTQDALPTELQISSISGCDASRRSGHARRGPVVRVRVGCRVHRWGCGFKGSPCSLLPRSVQKRHTAGRLPHEVQRNDVGAENLEP